MSETHSYFNTETYTFILFLFNYMLLIHYIQSQCKPNQIVQRRQGLKRWIFIPFYTSQPRASLCKSLLALSWYKLEHYILYLKAFFYLKYFIFCFSLEKFWWYITCTISYGTTNCSISHKFFSFQIKKE